MIVKMEVTVTVTPPKGQTLNTQQAIELAMSAVTQRHEVACGRDIGENYDRTAWAEIYAEVSDSDCEVIE